MTGEPAIFLFHQDLAYGKRKNPALKPGLLVTMIDLLPRENLEKFLWRPLQLKAGYLIACCSDEFEFELTCRAIYPRRRNGNSIVSRSSEPRMLAGDKPTGTNNCCSLSGSWSRSNF